MHYFGINRHWTKTSFAKTIERLFISLSVPSSLTTAVISTNLITSRLVPYMKCPLCHNVGEVEVSVFQSHVLFVVGNFFPVDTFGAAFCHSCSTAIPTKSAPQELAAAYKEVSSNVPLRWTSFSGLILMAALLAMGGVYKLYRDQQTKVLGSHAMAPSNTDPRPSAMLS